MKGSKQGDGERTSKRGRVDGNRKKVRQLSEVFSTSHAEETTRLKYSPTM